MIVYAAVDDARPRSRLPLGVALGVFIRREDAEPQIAAKLRIEERELHGVGWLN